jgi:hypothetical protein
MIRARGVESSTSTVYICLVNKACRITLRSRAMLRGSTAQIECGGMLEE